MKQLHDLEMIWRPNDTDPTVLEKIELFYKVRDSEDAAMIKAERIVIDSDLDTIFTGNAAADWATVVGIVMTAEEIE